MSMPIQRQSEQYGVFDDGPRFARDRSSTDLPKGLAGLINTTGPRIQAGLLNTREAAGYDFGKGPRDHGGHGPDGGPSVPDWYYEDDDDDNGDPPDKNFVSEDPWGRQASRHPFDRAAVGRLAACQECGDDVLPREGDWEHVNGPSDHLADPDEDDIANDEYGEGLDPARGMDAYKQRREMMGHRTAADAAVMDPTQMQVPLGGGYQPAHRVGLPWRDQVIPGTVIGLDGPNVNVRWDDGQYSIEEPHNIQLL